MSFSSQHLDTRASARAHPSLNLLWNQNYETRLSSPASTTQRENFFRADSLHVTGAPSSRQLRVRSPLNNLLAVCMQV
jgi:hypothetical protein